MCMCCFWILGELCPCFQGRARRALFSLRGIRVKACQEIQSSLLARSCVLLPRVTWIEFSACFKGWGRGLLFALWRPQGEPDFSCQGLKFGRAPSFFDRSSFWCIETEEEMLRSSRPWQREKGVSSRRQRGKQMFLEKLEGPVFWIVGVEDLPRHLFLYQEVEEQPSSFLWN